MAKRIVEKVIGKHRYRIRQLGADAQDEIVTRVILGASRGTLTVADVVGAKEAMREATMIEVVDEQSPSEVKPRSWVPLSAVYNDLLADDMVERAMWLDAAVEVSFQNFSRAVGVLLARQQALSISTSPTTPDGSLPGSSSTPG